MIELWLGWYKEPLFWQFPLATFLLSFVAFAVFAAPLTWLMYRQPAWAEKYRIQERRMPVDQVLKPSLLSWLRNNAWMALVLFVTWPLLRLSGVHAGPLPPWYVVAGQIVLFVYLDDFLFYWMHRALHHKLLYKKVHAIHHRVYAPWACTGNYMHPLEFVLIGMLAQLGPVLVGAHVVTIYLWIILRQWEAAEGHSGYSFPWNPSHLFPGYGGTEYHDFHHAKFRGNYAGFLGYLDRFFGTYSKGYLAYKEAHAHKQQDV